MLQTGASRLGASRGPDLLHYKDHFKVGVHGTSNRYTLDRKRVGAELSDEELKFFVHSLMDKRLTQAQVGAFVPLQPGEG